ncbi:MAG: SPOR domain-containing protein [Chlorobi bacterium]|nr:SPOR domain-containing protein [Chlorobiota bacterium]
MSYKRFSISLLLLLGLFVNKSLVAQFTADYLLADNLPAYSPESNSENKGLPYSLDYIEIAKQEGIAPFEGELSDTYVVVRKGKRRGKGKGGYSFRINLEYDLPEKIISGSTFQFKCKISKGDLTGSAKLTQRLPIGFDIVESVIGGAKTKYSNYTLNLIWDEVPVDSIIEISYNVVVNRSYGYLPISSILYFEETGKKYLFNTHVLVDKEQPAEDLIVYSPPPASENDAGIILVETVKPGKNSGVMPSKKYNVSQNKKEIPEHRPIVISESPDMKTGAVQPDNSTIGHKDSKKPGTKTRSVAGNSNTTNTSAKDYSANYSKASGKTAKSSNQVVYSIQILALMYNNVNPENLKRKYHIAESVKVEKFNNWRKYTVGHFISLREAKASLANIKQKGLKDAFIVGYKDGFRFLVY